MTLKCFLALVILALTGLHPLLAQRQLFHEYASSDGLDNLNVRCLFQDETGFIWVGTDNGLFRYDGGHFQAFGHAEGLADTEILSITQSPDGRLWIGTNSGISVMAGDHFKTVNLGDAESVTTIGFDANSTMYFERDSEIMRGMRTGDGSYSFRSIAQGEISGLSVKDQDIFFGKDGDLWHVRGDAIERFGSRMGLPSDMWGATILDTLGNRWVRSRTRLYELPRGQSRFVDRSEGIQAATDTHLYTDRHANVFVTTMSSIVSVAGARRTAMDARHGLPADPSGPMLIDREDLLWFGTNGAGLVRRLGHGEWTAWTKSDGLLRNSVWSVATTGSGSVWVGTNGGLTIFDEQGTVRRQWTSRNGLEGDRVLSILHGSGGNFYAGVDGGSVSQFSEEGKLLKTYRKSSGLRGDRVSALALDHEGRLWAVGTGGCFRSGPVTSGQRLKFDAMQIPGVSNRSAFRDVIVDDDDSVWIASSKGLLHLKKGVWSVLTAADGLKSENLGLVTKGKGKIWIAYRDALGMTSLQGGPSGITLNQITAAQGLRSDAVYAVKPDRKGRLWVATDMGVDVLEQGRWKHFGSEDGLIWNDTDSLALHVDSADDIWIGTSGGLSRYAQPEFPPSDGAAPIVITSITGTSQQWEASENPSIAYDRRSLTIQYAALSYESSAATRFRYRLSGFEPDWNETTERSVHFAALPPGSYVFEVVYAQQNGAWNAVPAKFNFTIAAPWWRTWWFMAMAVITLLLIGSASIRIRLRRLESQKKELEHQVADRTAELVTSHRQLEEIAYYDMLTTTPNRRMFVEEFRKRSHLNPGERGFALLLIDLDRFKHINDTFGHDAGDAVLMTAANRLKAEVHEQDFVARLGGDEFAILLYTAKSAAEIEAVCRRILARISAPFVHESLTLQVGCSIGIALYPHHAETQESLYKAADVALYQAKHGSRNTFRWCEASAAEESPHPILAASWPS